MVDLVWSVASPGEAEGLKLRMLKYKMTESTNSTEQPVNAMTVDVEDYFQVSAFDPFVERSTWDNYAGRVEESTVT